MVKTRFVLFGAWRSSRALLSVALLIMLVDFLTAGQITAQSCPAAQSCKRDNGCSGGGYNCIVSDPTVGAFGSDPACYFSNPDPCRYTGNGCGRLQYDGTCCVRVSSPIILDLDGGGFHLSDAADGVWFKVFPKTTSLHQVAWPVSGSHNGWLVLDRNGNGIIDDFGEFFGDQTIQPAPLPGQLRNGFAALAVYDRPDQGGNGDGWISKADAIYDKLLVWVDENHDGASQVSELHTLASLDISAIRLTYELSQMTDAYGNSFRFRSRIRDAKGGTTSKIIYDVYLTLGSTRSDDATANWFIGPRTVGFVEDSPVSSLSQAGPPSK